LEAHAAPIRSGIESCAEFRPCEAVDQTLHEIEVHTADEVGELLGKDVKRAVCQRHAVGVDTRLVAEVVQYLEHGGQQNRATVRRSTPLAGLPAEVVADQSGGSDQGNSDRDTLASGVGHSSGEQTPDALVPTGRQADGQLSRRPTVELGRSTCARSSPPRRAPKLALDQPVIDQLVEMELGDVMDDTGSCGGHVAANGIGL